MTKIASFYDIIKFMKIKIAPTLYDLAVKLNGKLFVVGGYVRNYLLCGADSPDVDLAGKLSVEELIPVLNENGFTVLAEYKKLGTLKFRKDGNDYEYTRMRTESYKDGGFHTPESILFTDDILSDALRRDFKCNAIYYDIANDEIVDLVGGVDDINSKTLSAVTDPEKVFKSDGLRLMRAARFSAELGFSLDEETLNACKKYAKNILDVSPERIYDELKKILSADTKYPFSPKDAHYRGLKVLEETGVLEQIMPELTLGHGMPQRRDFHDYDVLEHSLRTCLYAPQEVRLDGLLHDIAKPFCYLRDGVYWQHAEEGERIAEEILYRLRAPKKEIERVKFTVKSHMHDLKNDMDEDEIRLFMVNNMKYLEELFMVRQADYSAGKDETNENAGVRKWRNILKKMQDENVPFTLKELRISALDLIQLGAKEKELSHLLKALHERTVLDAKLNDNATLKEIAKTLIF